MTYIVYYFLRLFVVYPIITLPPTLFNSFITYTFILLINYTYYTGNSQTYKVHMFYLYICCVYRTIYTYVYIIIVWIHGCHATRQTLFPFIFQLNYKSVQYLYVANRYLLKLMDYKMCLNILKVLDMVECLG